MRKFGRIVLAALLTTVLFVPMVAMPSQAKKITDDWTEKSAEIPVADGVTCQTIDGVLYIRGTGAIPDYTNDTLHTRPWNNHLFQAVNIDEGITYIGAKAFKNFKKLRFINASVKTYLSGSDAFENIYEQPTVRLSGTEETVEMLGDKVPYTSLGSWAPMVFRHANNMIYIMDNGTIKNQFKQKTDPYLTFVFSVDNSGAVWKEYTDSDNAKEEKAEHKKDKNKYDKYTNVYDLVDAPSEKNPEFVSPLRFADGYAKTAQAVTANRYPMSKGYLELIAWILTNTHADYNYGVSYNCSVSTADKIYDTYETPQKYTLTLPTSLQAPGRTFKAVVVKDGQPTVLDDLDLNDATVTFETTYGAYQLSIIYK
ncbi:MAG: hypothetical protein K5641_05385 [Lachnospiraceae bacterium]|nr:hypothetical protein [Lachnospiraceae bacterium]